MASPLSVQALLDHAAAVLAEPRLATADKVALSDAYKRLAEVTGTYISS